MEIVTGHLQDELTARAIGESVGWQRGRERAILGAHGSTGDQDRAEADANSPETRRACERHSSRAVRRLRRGRQVSASARGTGHPRLPRPVLCFPALSNREVCTETIRIDVERASSKIDSIVRRFQHSQASTTLEVQRPIDVLNICSCAACVDITRMVRSGMTLVEFDCGTRRKAQTTSCVHCTGRAETIEVMSMQIVSRGMSSLIPRLKQEAANLIEGSADGRDKVCRKTESKKPDGIGASDLPDGSDQA